MSSRRLVHPALLAGLDRIPLFDLSDHTLGMMRDRMAARPSEAVVPPLPEGVEETVRTIEGGDGQPLDLLVYRPVDLAGPLPCLLHIHGGGYVMGSAWGSAARNAAIAQAAQCLVVSVDYRLAPETRYPGSLEDCYAALQWLDAQADALDIDRRRLAIRGESAGGGLAAALSLYSRDRGGPRICHQTLIYPMIDDRTGTTSDPHAFAGEFVWSPASNSFGWASLLGKPAAGADTPAYAAVARADDLSGLPPTFIASGALDLFVEEDMEFARRLMRFGVPTELHIYPGAFHGFDVVPDAPPAQAMTRDALAALATAFRC